MHMNCQQCQEARGNKGCRSAGVCGKDEKTANLQDLLVFVLCGMSEWMVKSTKPVDKKHYVFMGKALFSTITNANFDEQRILELIKQGLSFRQELADARQDIPMAQVTDAMRWIPKTDEDYVVKSQYVGIDSFSSHEDIRALKSLLLYGLKGVAAYADHAVVLGSYDVDIYAFMAKGLSAVFAPLSAPELTGLVLRTGDSAVKTMALLDQAHTSAYGHPEITKVKTGVGKNPGVLISGHDLKDIEELLKQTQGKGVDVYTHSEMLPAHYYPAFKKYDHFVGNYGSAWWNQNKDFESFNGPILMTTNCIVPIQESYSKRLFTTGMAGYPGVAHIEDRLDSGQKDFSALIQLALTCPSPKEIENGEIVGGFAHQQVLSLADKVVSAVKSGAIKRFVVMAGCDGRQPHRHYFTDVAETLPKDAVILTAGCAKYRYNKLNLGDIQGIPRVLDAGQCNDSYSLAVVALKLKEVFGLNDVNDLPLSFDIAWYEQKAVAVLLALLSLGFKGIKLGPTLPAFLSPGVVQVLVEKFDIQPIGSVKDDVDQLMGNQALMTAG